MGLLYDLLNAKHFDHSYFKECPIRGFSISIIILHAVSTYVFFLIIYPIAFQHATQS